jgi:alkylhydroperoxidase family enzyme
MTYLSTQEEAELDATIQKIAQDHGYISNLMQTLALAPRALTAFAELGAYVRYGSHLTELQRILAMVIAVRDVHYGWSHTEPLAVAAGLSPEQLLLLREGRVPKDLSSTERALCAYAFEITAGRRIPARVAEEMHAHFVPRQIVDIALLTVQFMSIAALALALDVPTETPDILQYELEWQLRKTAADAAGP